MPSDQVRMIHAFVIDQARKAATIEHGGRCNGTIERYPLLGRP